jgi:hypothetical protein
VKIAIFLDVTPWSLVQLYRFCRLMGKERRQAWHVVSCLRAKWMLSYTISNLLKFKLNYDRHSVRQCILVLGTHLAPLTNFHFSLKFSFDSSGFVVLYRPLWREGVSVIYCCSRSSPAQSRGAQDHILLSQFLRLPQPGGPGVRIYIPKEQGGPDMPPGTGFPFRRFLRLVTDCMDGAMCRGGVV